MNSTEYLVWKYFAAVVVLLMLANIGHSQAALPRRNQDSTAVQKAAEGFLEAFRNLEWEKFRGFFADDATAFFPPSAHYPKRADGKTEIEKVFQNVFENARKQRSAPPFLKIDPEDLEIQMLKKDVAVVTFHLDDPGLLGRRTVVFQKRKGKWLIIHLHASGTLPN